MNVHPIFFRIEISWPSPKLWFCLVCFRFLLFSMASTICFLLCLQMSASNFRLSLSYLVSVDSLSGFSILYLPATKMAASWNTFAVASPLESRLSGGINASAANLFRNSTWGVSYDGATYLYLPFLAGDHFCSLKLGVNPCFPSYHAMITTRVATVDDWSVLSAMMQSISFFFAPLREIHIHCLFSPFLNKVFIIFNLCRSENLH